MRLAISHSGLSHPTRVRGLKPEDSLATLKNGVAPHTGAWIETSESHAINVEIFVAPHTGAWIETSLCVIAWYVLSRTPHGCVD